MNEKEIQRVMDIAAEQFRKFPQNVRNNPFSAFCKSDTPEKESEAGTALRLEAVVDTCNFLLNKTTNIGSCGIEFGPYVSSHCEKCGSGIEAWRAGDCHFCRNAQVMGPEYEHDCPNCTFLGKFEDDEVIFDLYYCGNPMQTVVARYSDDGPKYVSGISVAKSNLEPSLTEALKRAIKGGYCESE